MEYERTRAGRLRTAAPSTMFGMFLVMPWLAGAAQGPALQSVDPLNPPLVSATTWDYTRAGSSPPYYDGPITVTASGGVPPYTYAWQRVSGNTTIHATNPTSHTTSFQKAIVNGGWWTSVWRCRVTDSVGQMAYSPNVTVTFEWDNGQ